jgi:predicted Rossmann fold flavoprotein
VSKVDEAESALAQYETSYVIELVERHHILYHEKTLGHLFCDPSAHDIVEMLETECRAAGVQIIVNSEIREIRRADGFIVCTESGEVHAPVLVVATGGLSIPKLGATSLGYAIARQFRLKIRETRPALVPLILGTNDRAQYCDLAGVSVEVEVSTDHSAFREKMLITHRGLSGPAILQISTDWREHSPIRIDLAPGHDVTLAIREAKERNMTAARSALLGILPKRFATRWLDLHTPPAWTNRALEELEHQVHEWVVEPAGTEGYEKAEVTVGGVDTEELSGKSMESRRVPGLFFIGEVVDVTGHLGGFNFQWAWASGAAAGRAL